jgi:hypothetical protein
MEMINRLPTNTAMELASEWQNRSASENSGDVSVGSLAYGLKAQRAPEEMVTWALENQSQNNSSQAIFQMSESLYRHGQTDALERLYGSLSNEQLRADLYTQFFQSN